MHPSRMVHAYLQRIVLLSALVLLSGSAQVLGQSDKECLAGLFDSSSDFDPNGPCAGLSVTTLNTDILCSEKCFSAVEAVAICYSSKPDCDPSKLDKYNTNVLYGAEALCARVLPSYNCASSSTPAESPGLQLPPDLATTMSPEAGAATPPSMPSVTTATPSGLPVFPSGSPPTAPSSSPPATAQAPAPAPTPPPATPPIAATPSPPPPALEARLAALYECANGVFFTNGSVDPTGPCQSLLTPANKNQICDLCYPATQRIANCYVLKPSCEGTVLKNYTNMVLNPADNLCMKKSPAFSCGALPPPTAAPGPAPVPTAAAPAPQPVSAPAPGPKLPPLVAPPAPAPGPSPFSPPGLNSTAAFLTCTSGVFTPYNGTAVYGGPCSVFVDGSKNASAVCNTCYPSLDGIASCFKDSPACDNGMLKSYIDKIRNVAVQCGQPLPPNTCGSTPGPSPAYAPAPVVDSCASGVFTSDGFDPAGPCAVFRPGVQNLNATAACMSCYPPLSSAFDCYTGSLMCDQSTLTKFQADILNGVALQCGQTPPTYICGASSPPPPVALQPTPPPLFFLSPPPPSGSASHTVFKLSFIMLMGMATTMMMITY